LALQVAALWLDPKLTIPERGQPLLAPHLAGEMEASPVSTEIHHSAHDGVAVLHPRSELLVASMGCPAPGSRQRCRRIELVGSTGERKRSRTFADQDRWAITHTSTSPRDPVVLFGLRICVFQSAQVYDLPILLPSQRARGRRSRLNRPINDPHHGRKVDLPSWRF
jgi:hypothetical protein